MIDQSIPFLCDAAMMVTSDEFNGLDQCRLSRHWRMSETCETSSSQDEKTKQPKFGYRLANSEAVQAYEPPCMPNVGPLNMTVAASFAFKA